MKTLYRLLIVLVIAAALSFLPISPSAQFSSTIFNVAGIMFSLGLGLIVTFNLSGAKNKSLIDRIRYNLKKIKDSFILHFVITVLSFITDQWLRNIYVETFQFTLSTTRLTMNLLVIPCVIMLFTIIYFIANFLSIQRLGDDIFDEINK